MHDLTGQSLGQYEIIKLIGRGGMASVYLARQRSIGRTVAVKVLPPHLMHDQTFLKRFQREVQAVAMMQHPRIIPVHDYGEEQGMPYIVMAYIDGGSLSQQIQDRGQLPLDEAVRLVGQIAEGLDYAHKQGVIHRDFKPSNVLLDHNSNAYLADFGIAKVSQETAQLTGSGIVGTPTYMAPEMFKQETATPAVDIYALGVTLYQMLSGTTPYEGATPVQLMYAHLNDPVPNLEDSRHDIPRTVQGVLEKGMAKDPQSRFASAGQLARALEQAAEEHQEPETLVTAPGPSPHAEPAPKQKGWLNRNWRISLSIVILVLAILSLAPIVPGVVIALLAGLALMIFHITKRQWWTVVLWLFLSLCSFSGIVSQGTGGYILFRIGLLTLSIAGVVIEAREKRRATTAQPAPASR